MTFRMLPAGPLRRSICVVLAITMAVAPSVNVLAQGAVQAVRQRVQGLGGTPSEEHPPSPGPVPGEFAPPPYSPAGNIDTTYIAPSAAVILIVRPAQIMSAPLAELLPTEVASAAGLTYLGIDPATVDEVVAFLDLSNPAGPAYGVTIKFNQPFRGSAIPPPARPAVQLSELAGRKYLQSAHPVFPSFYGTNRTTLIAAPDATLRQLVESAGQTKTGSLIDRVRDVPAGSDLYLAVDVASLRPFIQMAVARAPAAIPANVKPLLEAPNLIAAAELTLNFSVPGPTSLVLQANDESAAQQLETMLQEASAKYQASPEAHQAALDDPVAQAMARYRERISRPFTPQRHGASLTCFHIDGQDPSQQQLAAVAVIGILIALSLPALQKAREAAQHPPPQPGEPSAEQPSNEATEQPADAASGP
jgi:hypothetical protein